MSATKFILAIAFCALYTSAKAYPLTEDAAAARSSIEGGPIILLIRNARSPSPSSEESSQDKQQEGDHGRVELKYEDTERGREGSFKYNHNLLKSDDGSYSVDAYAKARRNYDWNQNDFQGGLEGRWEFKG
ncbi:uncharacterized protein LOC101452993 [Ceratitis capitata]|uniref:uncharacterized protein LOC101452993 n=1 Tax=Ceratitis capitata TaxID=7213 RepID=UPI000329E818|nr:uncharacterized protein LOC101452993 [Ceratitis capitata]